MSTGSWQLHLDSIGLHEGEIRVTSERNYPLDAERAFGPELQPCHLAADVVTQVLDASGLPSREVRRVCRLVLVFAMLAFPLTFRHGFTVYVERKAKEITTILQHALPVSTSLPHVSSGSGGQPRLPVGSDP